MFVAKHLDDSVWSIECAIPIKDLDDEFKTGDAWRVNFQRRQTEEKIQAEFWGLGSRNVGQLLQF